MSDLPPAVSSLISRIEETLPLPDTCLPSVTQSHLFIDAVLGGLFFECRDANSQQNAGQCLHAAAKALAAIFRPLKSPGPDQAAALVTEFFEELPGLRAVMLTDAEALVNGDPAAEDIASVIQCYPGFFAAAVYRIAHFFWQRRVPVFPRILTEYAHSKTGIDIHPGAVIGSHFFIDHGTGVVIGETTVIGDRVKLYQGVTLGALSVDKKLSGDKRHPTLEDDVVVYANATILGGSTVIGHHSTIGGSVWVTSSIPPHSLVYHRSEVKVRNEKGSVESAHHVLDWSI